MAKDCGRKIAAPKPRCDSAVTLLQNSFTAEALRPQRLRRLRRENWT